MTGVARHKGLLLGVVAVLAAVALFAATNGGTRTGATWDPDNPDSRGGQAVARVLADRGVDVSVVRSAADLETAEVAGDTTVVVTSSELLGDSTARRLLAATRAGHLIVVEPPPVVLEALGVGDGYPVSVGEGRAADCTDGQLSGLTIEVDEGYEYPTPQGCFAGDQGFLVGTPSAGVTLLGAGRILENDRILRADNAAAALRLLGERDRLVWYVPDLTDLTADDAATFGSLLPPWIKPGLWVLTLAVVGLMLWRGRRLGALATEPLPVVVKAIETTRSRGRLYRKANDRDHAAAVLRTAARRRLVEHLHLPASVAEHPQQLLDAVTARSGRPLDEVRDLLRPDAPAPRSDKDLITLATALAELDREVRRT